LLTSCGTRNMQNETKAMVSDSIINLYDDSVEYLSSFFSDFAFDHDYQLERIKFPIKIQIMGKESMICKSDWKHDSLFMKLEYSTYIINSHDVSIDMFKCVSDKSSFSWIYPDQNKKKDYFFIRENGKWYLSHIRVVNLHDINTEDFISFLKKFMSDSLYQVSRVKFPINKTILTYSDKVEDFVDTIRTFNQSDWSFLSINKGLEYLTNYSCSWNTDIKESKEMQLVVVGVGNGINIHLFFSKIDRSWFLIKFTDYSD